MHNKLTMSEQFFANNNEAFVLEVIKNNIPTIAQWIHEYQYKGKAEANKKRLGSAELDDYRPTKLELDNYFQTVPNLLQYFVLSGKFDVKYLKIVRYDFTFPSIGILLITNICLF